MKTKALLEYYLRLKSREVAAYGSVQKSDRMVQEVERLRNDVYGQIESGKAPDVDDLSLALCGPEIAKDILAHHEQEWLDLGRMLAEALESLEGA